MSDIELVIKIPEEMYKWVNDVNKFFDDYGTSDFIDLVKNGTPLPKGHGRLIDADALWKKWVFDAIGKQEIDEAPTIIEADIPTMYYPQVEGITPTVISSNGSDMLSAEEIDNLLQALAKGESEE